MGFAEDVKAKINESLNGRIKAAEETVKKTELTQAQCITDAAGTKLLNERKAATASSSA